MARLEEKKRKILNFKGCMAAVAAPFDQNGDLNLAMIPSYIKHLHSINVKGIYIHGTTGEGLSMTDAEKQILTKEWYHKLKALKSDIVMVVNVSSTTTHEMLSHARLCQELDVDGIALLPPFYYKPSSISHLVKYVKMIYDAAPSIPIIYYHIPSFTEVNVNLDEFFSEAVESIPALCGMKFTSVNIVELQRLQRKFKSTLKFFAGFEEMLLPSLACGINAGVCALFNFEEVSEAYNKMIDIFTSDIEEARLLSDLIAKKLDAINSQGDFFYEIKNTINKENKHQLHVGKPRAPITFPN